MTDLPATIQDEPHLDDLLSTPWDETVDLARRLDGDVIVLGAGGKIGPTLVRLARRALDQAGSRAGLFAVARRRPARPIDRVTDLAADLTEPAAVARLPDAANVLYLVGRKFGSTGREHDTWAVNVAAAVHAADRYARARLVMFSTGCVYPLMHVSTGGATEATPPAPVGEYAMTCLGRERVFEHASRTRGLRVLQFRLNYAVEPRYGVLVDIGRKVRDHLPVDLTTGHLNALWQGDVCNQALLALDLAASPPAVLNVTGPETLAAGDLAEQFGRHFGRPPVFTGEPNGMGYLSNASRSVELFGPPRVGIVRVLAWTADWLARDMPILDKPTHYEVQNGQF